MAVIFFCTCIKWYWMLMIKNSIYCQQNPWILILFLKWKHLCLKEIVASTIQLVKIFLERKLRPIMWAQKKNMDIFFHFTDFFPLIFAKSNWCNQIDVINDFSENKCEQFLKCFRNMQAQNLHYIIALWVWEILCR